jgi:hypothetical protein
MIKMTYHNDGKEKFQSHEISIREDLFSNNLKLGLWSHNPFNITGYGETKEEAIKDFKNKFAYIMKELQSFENMLFDTDVITDNIIEVDCMGKPIENKQNKIITVEFV